MSVLRELRTVAFLFSLLAVAPTVSASVELLPVAASGAPFRIAHAELDASDGALLLTLQNTSDQALREVFIAGKVFSNGVGVGGWLVGRSVDLQPGDSTDVRYAAAQTAAAPGGDTVLLVPFLAYGRVDGGESALWALKAKALKQLSPGNAGKPLGTGDSAVKTGVTPPELAGLCCESCSQSAHSCGDAFLRGNCRTIACISSYNCKASTNPSTGQETCECGYSCRDPESCC